ncbi:hypothetical protein [Antiquaquibacter soli]|uniref:Uncharacterized protein n=1 Tax=Antiquaquibacter soli TaxID=3064523 RepID=A0ABT9BPG7_9MICO|nr:hypothetical protein [Protaetiibacter sp. WY-16]MDO7881681.1 hypothetical protein [Protaetiibacter sp. WY-16]
MDDTQAPHDDPTTPSAPSPEASVAPPALPLPPVEAPPAEAPPVPVAPPVFAPPVFAPPSYPPPATPAPPAPPTDPPATHAAESSGSGRTIAIVVAIITACVLVLIGLGVAIFFVAQSAIRALDTGASPVAEESADPDQPRDEPTDAPAGPTPEILPLIEGAPGPAVAIDPLLCPGDCFPADAFGGIGLDSDVYAGLGALEQTEAWGDYADTTPGKEYTYSARYWNEGEGTPAECFPVYTQVPVATPFDVRPDAPDDVIAYLGYYETSDQYSGLQESGRLFVDSASAETHMTTLQGMIASCTGYEIGSGDSYWTADVTPMPALDVPASVAAVGWVEDSPWGRFYAVDLQRGNLVIRAALYTDGVVGEEGFRQYAEQLAEQLADLETE